MRLLLYTCLILLAGCKKEEEKMCDTNCKALCPTIGLSGYTLDEVDTVYVRTFKKNGLFDKPRESKVDTCTDTLSFPGHTTKQYLLLESYISPYLDYEIEIPATSQTFRVAFVYTNLKETIACNYKPGCEATLTERNITGGSYHGLAISPSQLYIFLEK